VAANLNGPRMPVLGRLLRVMSPTLVQTPICARVSISAKARFVIDREGFGMVGDCVSFNNLHRLRTFDNLHWSSVDDLPTCLNGSHKPVG
jgi:hypothetical protein